MLNRTLLQISFLLAFSLYHAKLDAQMVKISFEMNMDTVEINKHVFTGLGETETYFRMNYGQAQITNPKALKYLKGKVIDEISLIYTDFPVGEDLEELNQRRLAALYSIIPDVFSSPVISWKLVKQTGCASQTQAYDYFHGFAIRYHDAPSRASMALESSYIKDVLKGNVDLSDSSLFKVLERNKENWKAGLVVSDLTGSMSPYIAQLLLWFKLNENSNSFKHVTFFNDGDAKLTQDKKIGKTGGIYHENSIKWDKVAELAYLSMSNGSGGDGPENDIEGILSGAKACSDCKDIILIADNNSQVRDLKLLEKIDRPVHIILCGSLNSSGMRVNIEYLQLAYKTGGTIHTIEEDLTSLAQTNEGEVLNVAGHLFKVVKGEFIYLGKEKKA